ncbi:hypothetical protein, partial [Corallococcus sp. 4LFB]|uniref:hypothetical protein n=1 Tax=Corallococcus sp. 4LFB TaxID=3383249 RepID=UPI003974BEA8
MLVLLASTSWALAPDAGTEGAVVPGGAPTAPDAAVDPRWARIQALIDGTLDVGVSPQSLFDVPLGDEPALQVEALRVRALLR